MGAPKMAGHSDWGFAAA